MQNNPELYVEKGKEDEGKENKFSLFYVIFVVVLIVASGVLLRYFRQKNKYFLAPADINESDNGHGNKNMEMSEVKIEERKSEDKN